MVVTHDQLKMQSLSAGGIMARLPVFRTYALLRLIVNSGVVGDASSRGVDGTVDEAHTRQSLVFVDKLIISTYEWNASDPKYLR
jgi:hypothetical protein